MTRLIAAQHWRHNTGRTPLVENGNTVPMTISVASPMTADDHVKSIHVFNEKNPQPNVDNFDKRLAGSPVTQGQPTGYPLYRLEWQTLGSLERRLRSCMTGVRAQAYDYGAPELVALELYLMSRARGVRMETPAVRP